VVHEIRRHGYNYRHVVVIGTGERAINFTEKVKKHPEWGMKIDYILDYDLETRMQEAQSGSAHGSVKDLEKIIKYNPVDDVIFIVPRSGLDKIKDAVYICETYGIKATLALDLFNLKIARAKQTDIEGMPLITFETTIGSEWQLFIKRSMDIAVSLAGLVILSPLFLFVILLIKATSPGPAFYLQRRIGLNGRPFIMYKFRTMHKGSHQRLMEFTDMNIMGGPVFKIKNDPRVTPIGKFLRKFSIDELPQLYNVLIGHMSLVGPRPPLPKEVMQYHPWQRRRLSLRPGLTCLWQISGRNRINFEEWMKLDLQYIDNWSLWLDIKILIKTVPVVLFGVGAY